METKIFTEILNPESILIPFETSGFEAAIRQLVAPIASLLPPGKEKQLMARFVDVAKDHSYWSFGKQIAGPHAYVKGLDRILAVLGISAKNIEWPGTLDKNPVRIVFLVLTPEGEQALNSSTICAFLGVLEDERRRKQLLAAPSPQAALDILTHRSD